MSQEIRQVKSDPPSKLKTQVQANMFLMLVGKLVSLFGTFLYNFAISLYILRETGSGMSFAVTLILGTLPRLILSPFAGAIADRVDRKSMVVGMDVLSGAVVLSLWLVTVYSGLHLWYIYVAAVLLSICNTFFVVALEASIPNLVDNEHLMKVNSLSQGIGSLTQITAPMVGGLVYGLVDIKVFLFVNGISFILSGFSEAFIHFDLFTLKEEVKVDARAEKNSLLKIWLDMKEGFAYLRGQELLYKLFLFAIFINFFFSTGLTVPLPYIINNVIQLMPTQFGIIQGTIPVGILIASFILSLLPEFEKKYKVISRSLVLLSVALILIGVPATPAVMVLGKNKLFIFYLVLGLGVGLIQMFLNMPVLVMLQRKTANQYRGRVFGLIQTMTGAITPLAFLLAGLLIEVIPAYVLPIASGIGMLLLMVGFLTNRTLRQI